MNVYILQSLATVVRGGPFVWMASALAGYGEHVLAVRERSARQLGQIGVETRETSARPVVERGARGDQLPCVL